MWRLRFSSESCRNAASRLPLCVTGSVTVTVSVSVGRVPQGGCRSFGQ